MEEIETLKVGFLEGFMERGKEIEGNDGDVEEFYWW